MLIRSQDKLRLVPIETDSISIEKYKKINGEYHANAHPGAPGIDVCVVRGVAVLGEYSSEEKAIKVLDMIQGAYAGSLWTENHYDMAAQASVSDIIANNIVFEMPQDSEVEV